LHKYLFTLHHYMEEDQRFIHNVYSHKIIMENRVKYLFDNGYIKNYAHVQMSEKIKNLMQMARNLYLKYSITRNIKSLFDISSLIFETKSIELELLTGIESELRNNAV